MDRTKPNPSYKNYFNYGVLITVYRADPKLERKDKPMI
jgi:hypothetical protein